MKNIQLEARKVYKNFASNFKVGTIRKPDYCSETGAELETSGRYGYFEFKYPGWEITGQYKWPVGPKGERGSKTPPDGVYYLRRIGSNFLMIQKPNEYGQNNETRLKKNAEGELEIRNGELFSFTPHYHIFGVDHLKNTLAFECLASGQSTPNPHFYEN